MKGFLDVLESILLVQDLVQKSMQLLMEKHVKDVMLHNVVERIPKRFHNVIKFKGKYIYKATTTTKKLQHIQNTFTEVKVRIGKIPYIHPAVDSSGVSHRKLLVYTML